MKHCAARCSLFSSWFTCLPALAALLLLPACSEKPDQGDGPNGKKGQGDGDGDGGPHGDGDGGPQGDGDGDPGAVPLPGCELGYKELSDGDGGINVEQVCFSDELLNRQTSLAAFEQHVYPVLKDNCSSCHSSLTLGQAPIHADVDVELAHEYALTRVNFREPEHSKLVVRMGIDRHNCFGSSCSDANSQMLAAVQAWSDAVLPTLPEVPRLQPADQEVSESEVQSWIAADRATLSADEAPYIKYASLHRFHNENVSAQELDQARVALSKALNSAARWAPKVVNPIDINNKGLVYRFDTRDYWGFNKGVTRLHFGGSDDDIFFGTANVNYKGEAVTSSVLYEERHNFTSEVQEDPSFAQLVWERVLAGNVEGATDAASLPPNIDGFKSDYVEAGQLIYTLTRPDVYNAIMAIPWFADVLEDELGVITDQGMDSYQYMVTKQAITVDARMYYRANTKSGAYYWKTWDIFSGQLPQGTNTIEQAYEQGYIRFPFWANPIPKFVSGLGFGGGEETWSFIATLAQTDNNTAACDGQQNFGDPSLYNCRYYTGEGGLQQSAEEVIWGMPNGLQAYALFGAVNQRRVDAFTNIVRDPRLVENLSDEQMNSRVGFAYTEYRLNTGSSCIGCHADGMNRGNNDIRDWLDFDQDELPKGQHGVDTWINDEAVKERVRELYPPSSVMRPQMEEDRKRYLAAQAAIKAGMMLGEDKNTYVEPTIWAIEWARALYNYPITRSN